MAVPLDVGTLRYTLSSSFLMGKVASPSLVSESTRGLALAVPSLSPPLFFAQTDLWRRSLDSFDWVAFYLPWHPPVDGG